MFAGGMEWGTNWLPQHLGYWNGGHVSRGKNSYNVKHPVPEHQRTEESLVLGAFIVLLAGSIVIDIDIKVLGWQEPKLDIGPKVQSPS